MKQVLHHQNERRRRLAPRHRPHHLQRRRQVRAPPAERPGRGEGQEARVAQSRNVVEGKGRVAVVLIGRRGEAGRQVRQNGVEIGVIEGRRGVQNGGTDEGCEADEGVVGCGAGRRR